jgi:hypothetical protein
MNLDPHQTASINWGLFLRPLGRLLFIVMVTLVVAALLDNVDRIVPTAKILVVQHLAIGLLFALVMALWWRHDSLTSFVRRHMHGVNGDSYAPHANRKQERLS